MAGNTYEINVNLGNYQSIQKAEKILGKLSKEIDSALNAALVETADKMEIKCDSLLQSYKLGGSELASSIRIIYSPSSIMLVSDSDHLSFVEYGTGIYGKNSPHPKKPISWVYDSNEHGYEGWFYYDKAHKLRWTAGSPAKPFMYHTAMYGGRIIGSQVNKHINRLLKGSGL